MTVYSVSNRSHPAGQPGLPATLDSTNAAVIIRDALNLLGTRASVVTPERAFNGPPIAAPGDWAIVPSVAHERNADVERCFRKNGRGSIAWQPGGPQLDMLPRVVEDRLVDIVHLSIDRLAGTFGCYDPEQTLRKLALLNPGIVVVATNHQMALAVAGGVIYRQPAFRINGPALGEGKSAAFFAACFATWLETGDMNRALLAGHANGAAVAQSWVHNKALLNRNQLDEFVASAPAQLKARPRRRMTPIVLVAILAAILIGLTLLAAGAL